MNSLRRQQKVHRVSLYTWRVQTATSVVRNLQAARNRRLLMPANDSAAWKVRALTYLEKHLIDGGEYSRRIARIVRRPTQARPELLASLSARADGTETLNLLRSRLKRYLNDGRGLIVFARKRLVRDVRLQTDARSRLLDSGATGGVYTVAGAANEIDAAYRDGDSAATALFCLRDISLHRLRRSDGSIDVAAAVEHTVAAYVPAYGHDGFIGARIR